MSLILVAVPATGHLPLGRARILHAAWAEARRIGARFVLAVDDTLPPRPGAPLDDLAWLGLEWDDQVPRSAHAAHHAEAADRLAASGRLYPCFEHADELRAKADRQRKRGQPVIYDRAMLRLTETQREAAEAGGKRPHWRFRLSDHVLAWPDANLGRVEVALPTMSDPVLRTADGAVDAVLAHAADDIALGVTHIVGAAELVAQNAIHLDLLAALGTNPTMRTMRHLPVLAEAGDRRLQGQSIRALRHDGIAPAALCSWFEALAHESAPRAAIDDLLEHNRRVVASLPFAEVAHLLPGADEAHWLAVRGQIDLITDARDSLPRVGKS